MLTLKAPAVVFLAVVLLIAGCASSSGVVPMDRGMLSITKQQGSGFPGLGNLKSEVFQEAAAHCALQRRDFEVVDYSETKLPYILGNYPRVDLSFRCVN
jgi:hypothetical protein